MGRVCEGIREPWLTPGVEVELVWNSFIALPEIYKYIYSSI